ncbi:hypothetical protein BH23ACI1_BH23ACI1_12030 [soil metagenome]|nr:hypothetical protein [Acidobacteriota bacterium]
MTFNLEIVLREQNEAITERIHTGAAPADWTDAEVESVLKSMLLAIDRVRNPTAEAGEAARSVTLRGFSWIVEPTDGGVVIAIEITSGAAVAGPFDISQARLDGMVRRVLAAAAPSRPTIH